MPTELELIALNTEFDLYLPFSKRLVLNLPDSKDRSRAAMWLRKLCSIKDDNQKKLRNEHLKLFLFALHRRSLVGIFEKSPPRDELESFHDGLTLLEMTRELIEITEKKNQSGGDQLAEGECPLPKVTTNISHDLKEYSAMQYIPKFGAHVFYAVSSQPIQLWQKSENSDYPGMGDIPNQQQWETTLSKLSDHVLERQAKMDERIALLKAIEAGDASPDDLEPDLDFNKKIRVEKCPLNVFKWNPDSLLQIHQNYDFSDVRDAENIEVQGTHQLEEDEEAFTLLDGSTPGRKRVVIRDPYFDGLPSDITERRHHGVEDVIPDWDDDDEECEENREQKPAETNGFPCEDYNSVLLKEDNSCRTCNTSRGSATDNQNVNFEDTASTLKPQVYGRGYILDEFKEPNKVNVIQQQTASGVQRINTISMPYSGQFKVQSNQFIPRQKSQQINYYPAQMMQEQYYYPAQQAANYSTIQSKDTSEKYNYSQFQAQQDYECNIPAQEPNSKRRVDECCLAVPESPKNVCTCPPQDANDCSCKSSQPNSFSCSIKIEQNNVDYLNPKQKQNDYFQVSLQQNGNRFSSQQEQEGCTCSQQNDFSLPAPQQNDCSLPPLPPPPPPQNNCYSRTLSVQQNENGSKPPSRQRSSSSSSPLQQNGHLSQLLQQNSYPATQESECCSSNENDLSSSQQTDICPQQEDCLSQPSQQNECCSTDWQQNSSGSPNQQGQEYFTSQRKGSNFTELPKSICCESQLQQTGCCSTENHPNACCTTCCSSFEVQTTKIQVQQNTEISPQQFSKKLLRKQMSQQTENLYSNKNYGINNCDCHQ